MISFFWTMFLPMWSEVREARAAVLCVFGRPAGPARREDDAYKRERASERERERPRRKAARDGGQISKKRAEAGRERGRYTHTHTRLLPDPCSPCPSLSGRGSQQRVQDALSRQTPDRCNATTPSGLS
jgi:hypothetical protein